MTWISGLGLIKTQRLSTRLYQLNPTWLMPSALSKTLRGNLMIWEIQTTALVWNSSRSVGKLDELPVGERDEGVGEAQIRAFKVLTRLREASTSINQDPRIKYQIKRLNQTWEELCEMIKDCSKSSSELPYRQTQNPQNSRIPVYSRSGLKSRGLMDLENSISSLNTPPPSKSSKRLMPPSLGGRMTFNLSPVTDSPSYMISQKVGGNLRSESQSESPLQRPNSSCDFNQSTRRPSSRQGKSNMFL
ncbi:hypothetical protein PPACK8108_LOCUS9160 [Phakopsora pachyrhizi]|uniref:Uncharacterized protein n=1 Tax=Phakopsora pachyrhizi TaxID=170000 RepID=A0AAV0AZG3_PHAPC|nr:hypothetical protein PPACK8108_LOCUS9160 [Phakopsora pachyrhizi]